MNSQQTNSSLTFNQLMHDEDLSIEIPIIQRDYAQGRANQTEIRNNFVRALYTALKQPIDKGLPLNLDFVYGTKKGEEQTKFVPLDGQQRLTTLFLLHWYLMNKDELFDNESGKYQKNGLSKFAYKTRSSAQEFCDKLVKCKVDIEHDVKCIIDENGQPSEKALSKYIKNSSWYFLIWRRDPTVQSMLAMLDTLHSVFKDSKGFYSKLVSTKNPLITFHFLNLEVLNLTDDLYIKMNSRGRPLSEFENFKAKFEQHYKNHAELYSADKVYTIPISEQKVSILEYFSYKIDRDWSDLFWQVAESESHDKRIMIFVRALAAIHALLNNDNPLSAEKYKPIREFKAIQFSTYLDLNCFSNQFLIDLVELLDLITSENFQFQTHLLDTTFIDEQKLFKASQQLNLEFEHLFEFYGYFKFLVTYKNEYSTESLNNWARIVRNFSKNASFNSAHIMFSNINIFNEILLNNGNTILNYLSNIDNDINIFTTLIEEEKIKALLILKNKNWEQIVLKAENHSYFKGQIGFILNFSGIQTYFKSTGNCNWNDDENEVYFKSFNEYWGKACLMFDKNGLVEIEEHLWERALLTKGNYLLSKGKHRSFLVKDDRDISWKRLLRGSDGERRTEYKEYFENKRQMVKNLLDDINSNSFLSDLQNIVRNSNCTDWWQHFIKHAELIKYCKGKNIYMQHRGKQVMLLKGKAIHGYHAEYYTYLLKILLEKQDMQVSYETKRSLGEPKGITFINEQSIQIQYLADIDDNWKYCIFLNDSTTAEAKFEEVNEVVNYINANLNV